LTLLCVLHDLIRTSTLPSFFMTNFLFCFFFFFDAGT
jgi:hypothetical protein